MVKRETLASMRSPKRRATAKAAPVVHGPFDESVALDDPRPFPTWEPTPSQIAAACLVIQSTWSDRERMTRLRSDWRPQICCADRRLEAVTAETDSETGLFLKPEGI